LRSLSRLFLTQVIEASLLKERRLRKGVEPTTSVIEPLAPVIKPTGVASFLAARRQQAPPPSVPRVEAVAAFLANEPILAVPVNVAGQAEEPLLAAEGPIPSTLSHPLGSNIQHILEELDIRSEDFIGMEDDNMGPSTAAAAQAHQKPLSTIPETGTSSRASTPKKSLSLALDGVEGAIGSKRTRSFEAAETTDSASTAEFLPQGANWTFGGKLAKLGGDLKGNPFKAVVDLVDHDKL
jgi:hypothetical protein